MFKNENIICISSIDWDFIWQGHQEIMSTLARNGNRVLFIENTGVRPPGLKDISRLRKRFRDYFRGIKGIREESHNLYIFSPLVLPFPYLRIARWINKRILLTILDRWMKTVDFGDPIIWTFIPTGLSLDIIEYLNKKLTIYYCIDNFAVSSASAKKIVATENRLLKISDLVFVTSQALYDRCITYNKKVYLFPFGVNVDNFEKARISDSSIPQELKYIKRPIIGYVGGIHKWIDLGMVKAVAEKNPDYSFVLIGPIQTDISGLSGIKNIHFLGHKKHKELPSFVKEFSVGIIPYLITDYTRNVYPTKLNEYLAMGKPVISTDLPEIRTFNEIYNNIVFIAKDSDEFSSFLEKSLNSYKKSFIERGIEAARENSWESRIEKMNDIIDKAIGQRKLEYETKWKENLLNFYQAARRKAVRLSAAALLIYLFIFHTPLVWYLAEPLRISDPPRKADTIVVFAGGVGESGKAGQGYQERVEYAVELYKKKYADNLIFSSGYAYFFDEPLLMKALAVSLGVPEKAIILENKAGNTYENVEFTKKILDEKKWDKILLISSPYHMRRVYFVFNKLAKEVKVSYTPIPGSSFYAHRGGVHFGKRVQLKQLIGILHEYEAIVYYWLKNYI